MEDLKADLTDVANSMLMCDWVCVESCSSLALNLAAKGECFEVCNCYDGIVESIAAEAALAPPVGAPALTTLQAYEQALLNLYS